MASIAELVSSQTYKNLLTALNTNIRNTVNAFLIERNDKLKARQDLQKELQLARQERGSAVIRASNDRKKSRAPGHGKLFSSVAKQDYSEDLQLLNETKQLDNIVKQELIKIDIEIQQINEDIQLLEKALGEIQELETKAAVMNNKGKLINIFKDIRTKHEHVFKNMSKEKQELVQEESARKSAQLILQKMRSVTQQEAQLDQKELVLAGQKR